MSNEVLIYKTIDRCRNRPGVVAVATILLKTEPNGPVQRDITSKEEAIQIITTLINTLKIWEKYYLVVCAEVPNEIREYLWNFAGTVTFPKPANTVEWREWKESVDKLAKDYETLVMANYPGRSVQNILNNIKNDLVYYERLLNEFTNPDYYPQIP